MNTRHTRTILALILLLYLVLGSLFAVYTPPWQAPDEPAHYNYVRYLAEQGQFPVLHMGDYPHAYLEQIKAAGFPPDMSFDPIRYEFHQPPLYYALLALVYTLAGGSLLALRLVSVLLGAGIVMLAYTIGWRVFSARPGPALGAAAFVAFLPQHLATVAQVGNDVLAEVLLATTLWVLLQRMANGEATPPLKSAIHSSQSAIRLGFLLGLILITKTTAYIAVPLAGGVIAWRWWRERASFRRIAVEALGVIVPAALIALPWYARNISVYGWPDFLGLQRHDAIVLGQTRLADFVAQNGWAAYWQRAVEWTFKSFTGVFGWMGVWLDTRVYFALALLGGIAVAAWLLRGQYYVRRTAYSVSAEELTPRNTQYAVRSMQYAARLLTLSALLTFLAYIWYNTQFLQHQGRYLFTALIPIGMVFAAGWDAVARPGMGRWLAAGLALLAAGLAAWGTLSGTGLPKWPIAITAAAAVGVLLLDLALTWLHSRWESHPVLGRSYNLLRAAASAFPYAFLVIVSLYALFGEIVPQLT